MNAEAGIRLGGLDWSALRLVDVARETLGDCVQKKCDLGCAALRHEFNRPIRQVAHEASDRAAACEAVHRGTEADALHASTKDHPLSRDVGVCHGAAIMAIVA